MRPDDVYLKLGQSTTLRFCRGHPPGLSPRPPYYRGRSLGGRGPTFGLFIYMRAVVGIGYTTGLHIFHGRFRPLAKALVEIPDIYLKFLMVATNSVARRLLSKQASHPASITRGNITIGSCWLITRSFALGSS
jgi:hypothetical protein